MFAITPAKIKLNVSIHCSDFYRVIATQRQNRILLFLIFPVLLFETVQNNFETVQNPVPSPATKPVSFTAM